MIFKTTGKRLPNYGFFRFGMVQNFTNMVDLNKLQNDNNSLFEKNRLRYKKTQALQHYCNFRNCSYPQAFEMQIWSVKVLVSRPEKICQRRVWKPAASGTCGHNRFTFSSTSSVHLASTFAPSRTVLSTPDNSEDHTCLIRILAVYLQSHANRVDSTKIINEPHLVHVPVFACKRIPSGASTRKAGPLPQANPPCISRNPRLDFH